LSFQGLSEIHNAGFIHLDLKPANVLITFEGILKIGDFGLASPWPAAAGIDAEGDREYIGPEILKGDFDKPADIFSLGLVILEIACNVVLPENGPTWQALRRGDLSDVPSLTSTTSSEAVRDAMGIPLGSEECAGTADGTSYLGTASHPNFGIPKYRPLGEPPCFMVNMHHPSSLDQLVSAMLTPEPQDRVTIGQILEYYGLCWVAGRRRCAATVYEGSWGPDVATTHPACAEDDAVMTDV
jgi:mitosis inhibitor protein kinase SWE1